MTNADGSSLSEEAAEDFDPVFEPLWPGTLMADDGVMADSASTVGGEGFGGGSGMGDTASSATGLSVDTTQATATTAAVESSMCDYTVQWLQDYFQ
ncbi:unnamed protein product [Phytophthora lilii]|uniref:Unnamed protein product n=1 Tax=Phytophthora lilii TaxID=2077276 RepID=A0A9W6WPB7_9STRA|nr:unnamed protein product [Phytophthora lilii]